MISTVRDIAELGSILGIWAHPDDETYTMGGIMMAALKNGQEVACITATRGEAGSQDPERWPPAELAGVRTKELEAAFDIMGVKQHIWLDYPDGGCKGVPDETVIQHLAELIKRLQPDSILTFGPEGMTGHEDHKTVSRWTKLAVKESGIAAKIYHSIQTQEQYQNLLEADKKFNIFFNIEKPPVCDKGQCAIHFVLPDGLYDRKLLALRAMPSQTAPMFSMFADSLRTGFGTEAFIRPKV